MAKREALTLNEGTPQIVVPQAGDTYKFVRDVYLTTGAQISEVADGASAVAVTLQSPAYVTAGAKLLSVKNDTAEKFSVDKDGNLTVAGTFPQTVLVLGIACSDETTDLTTGTGKAEFQIVDGAFTLSAIYATVTTAPTGSTIIVDVNLNGTTLMTTNKISIDTSEKTSDTAATQPALTTTALTENGVITVDIDQVGSSTAGAGLKVYLVGTWT